MDYAYRETDRQLAELEKKISEIYADVSKELRVIIDDYFNRLVDRDEHQRELMEAGKITKEQYQLWRMAQIGRGERYIALQNEIAKRCNEANQVALSYVNDTTPGIYSLNYNYSAYTIEKVHGNVGFTLFDEQTVRRLLADDPELLPAPRIDIPLDLKWNKNKLQRELVTGIMLGESSGKIATRFQSITDMNRVSAIRNARTALTGAQNAGRQESYIRAKEMGIKSRKRWVATKDGRTRHSHGMLDGQTVDIDEFFVSENGSKMMYPGDRNHGADPCDVYNCRCGMKKIEKEGIEAEPRMMRVQNPKYTLALEEENKVRKKYDRALAKEKAETDPEKRKHLREERLRLQKQLVQKEKYRKSITKNVLVKDMNYREWVEWKEKMTADSFVEMDGEALDFFKVSNRDSLNSIVKRSTMKLQNGFACFPDGDPLNENIKKVKPLKTYFDVAMHGSTSAVGFGTEETNMSARLLASVIRHSEGYYGQKIRLLSCSTGKAVGDEYCFAEELANALGVEVKAPNDTLYISSKGRMYVGEYADGKFVTYTPNQRRRAK